MDNDALDSMDQFQRTVVAVADGLSGFAPAAIQDGIGGRYFCVAVASFDRMTPTRTLSAVRVWLRASDRISVTDLTIFQIMPGRIEGRNIFGRRRAGVIDGQVVGP
jgi:hypothetical protein